MIVLHPHTRRWARRGQHGGQGTHRGTGMATPSGGGAGEQEAAGGNSDGLIWPRDRGHSTQCLHTHYDYVYHYVRVAGGCDGGCGGTLRGAWQLPKKATPRGSIGPCTRCTTAAPREHERGRRGLHAAGRALGVPAQDLLCAGCVSGRACSFGHGVGLGR